MTANVLIPADFGGTPLNAVSKAFSEGKVYLSPGAAAEIGADYLITGEKDLLAADPA